CAGWSAASFDYW
nr:immunoglobulin heavy chain junction region [Macaca mulatta]